MTGLLDAVTAVTPAVTDGQTEADHRRALAPGTLAALVSAGLLSARVPSDLGGGQACLLDVFDALEALSYVDGAAGWIAAFMGGLPSAWPASRLDDDGVSELCAGGGWPLLAGSFVPSGRAEPAPGGWRITGRWGFASGIAHAAWLVAGCTTAGTGALRWFVVEKGAVQVHDTWHALGLRATGSHDFSVEHAFVPARRSFDVLDAPRRGGPAHALPVYVFLTPDHTAVTLGCARRALDEAARAASGRRRLGASTDLDGRGAFRRDLGRAATEVAAARALVRQVLGDASGAAIGTVGPELVLRCRVAATHAADVAIAAATFAHRSGGAHVLAADHPLERTYRDVMTATQHVHLTDEVYEQLAVSMAPGGAGEGQSGS